MVLALDHARHPIHPRIYVQEDEIMNLKIAFFDFDGTVTTKDTLLEFIRFTKGTPRFYTGFLFNSPWLFAYRLKIISNQAAKERILAWFFRNTPLTDFQESCDLFSTTVIPGLIRPKALLEIAELQEKGFSVVIVSASPENWLHKWTQQTGTSLLATRLETRPVKPPSDTVGQADSPEIPRLTGRILGHNCYGEEKVRRIREAYTLSNYTDIHTYGDSSGDKPMLRLGTASFFKPFR
jgi:phosphatidylglycerophosphatase C